MVQTFYLPAGFSTTTTTSGLPMLIGGVVVPGAFPPFPHQIPGAWLPVQFCAFCPFPYSSFCDFGLLPCLVVNRQHLYLPTQVRSLVAKCQICWWEGHICCSAHQPILCPTLAPAFRFHIQITYCVPPFLYHHLGAALPATGWEKELFPQPSLPSFLYSPR